MKPIPEDDSSDDEEWNQMIANIPKVGNGRFFAIPCTGPSPFDRSNLIATMPREVKEKWDTLPEETQNKLVEDFQKKMIEQTQKDNEKIMREWAKKEGCENAGEMAIKAMRENNLDLLADAMEVIDERSAINERLKEIGVKPMRDKSNAS